MNNEDKNSKEKKNNSPTNGDLLLFNNDNIKDNSKEKNVEKMVIDYIDIFE